ncbi:Glucan endo-1 3-beta-glucosidase 1 [Bienertia sinuspersici]
MVLKTSSYFHIFSIFMLLSIVATKCSAEVLTVYSNSNLNAASMAVSVDNNDLNQVANSVLMAETWLRNHVLPYYPAFNITHIVIGHNLLCSSKTHLQFHHLILPALKNFHHSLIRWGLNSEIKVSPSISSDCLKLSPDLSLSLLKPLLPFLKSTNSSYMVNPSSESPVSEQKIETLVSTHMKFLKKSGHLTMESLNFMVILNPTTEKTKPTMRKLNYILPTPSPEDLPIAKGPGGLPPLIGVGPTISPPSPISDPPHLGLSPTLSPHPHHHHHNLPPCNPGPPQAAPEPGFEPIRETLWCVAKPTVPAATLQEAMDYACGVGGAECDEIQPNGNCYYPNSLVSHASYAFNNYWQKNKINGGTCSFGGTAMLINSDPSFLHCRYILG